ncbi:MAG: SHOCT domain-containing protein [Lachnospiraceae bacterium]|nr:SHOCT domain-containing protein [Lachnospiraceae bacterium]
MKCLICGSDSSSEVCNKCIRLEKIIYQKEWVSREGGLIKKSEDFRVAISNLRISGRVSLADNPKGTNARLDNFSHYLMNVRECSQVTYGGKKTLMVTIENKGEGAYTRYCFLPGFDEGDQFVNAIFDAKTKAASLTERIRQSSGLASTPVEVTQTVASSDFRLNAAATAAAAVSRPAAAPTAAPKPAAAPASSDTVALAGIASDISEFETKIKKLKVLRDNGILSEEEYEAEKKKLVSIF